ncbi:MAG TPA: sigma-70 family RNA polymerase sigma factor [Solirubrobacteraceae bacterium]|nr:sigma-70 family RNA polymerase sigma factor [Solirubrobacteraceae bacterium]
MPLGRREDERALVLAASVGSERKREELIELLLPRIAGIARDYRGVPSVTREELMQAGVMGVLRALERFDPRRENQFWTYARWWVRQAMQELVSSLTHAVVLSDRATRHLARVKAAQHEHVQSRGREPSMRDLAARTGLEPAHVTMLIRASQPARALDVEGETEQPRMLPLAESIPDEASEDAFEHATLRVAARALPAVLATLTSKELMVIRGRYGFDGEPRAATDLAAQLRVSVQRVRQVEQAALRKLQQSCDVAATAA